MYCLATPTVLGIFRGDAVLKPRLEQLAEAHAHFSITPNTLATLYAIASKAEKKHDALRLVEEFSESVSVLEVTPAAAKKHAELLAGGIKLSAEDLWTAVLCIVHGQALVVRELEPWRKVPGLKLEKW